MEIFFHIVFRFLFMIDTFITDINTLNYTDSLFEFLKFRLTYFLPCVENVKAGNALTTFFNQINK